MKVSEITVFNTVMNQQRINDTKSVGFNKGELENMHSPSKIRVIEAHVENEKFIISLRIL